MVIFNSYVSLPEGIYIHIYIYVCLHGFSSSMDRLSSMQIQKAANKEAISMSMLARKSSFKGSLIHIYIYTVHINYLYINLRTIQFIEFYSLYQHQIIDFSHLRIPHLSASKRSPPRCRRSPRPHPRRSGCPRGSPSSAKSLRSRDRSDRNESKQSMDSSMVVL